MKLLLRRVTGAVLLLSLTFSSSAKSPSETNTGDLKNASESTYSFAPVTLTSSNLPIVIINTSNGKLSDIKSDVKVLADMKVIFNGENQRNYVTDQDFHYEGKINIKIRGHSSQQFDKKQYAIDPRTPDGTAKEEVSFFGMPASSKWVLSAVYSDKTLMRNALAYQLARELGQYAARTRFCEVIINGEYRGLYIFQEKIKRQKGRVDIKKLKDDDITGGYIFSIDKLDGGEITWNSPYEVYGKGSDRKNKKITFQFVEPDEDDLDLSIPADKTKFDYLKGYVTDFENALNGPNFQDQDVGFRKYIDAHSFVNVFLINEISRNVDGFRLSSYFYKDKGGLIVAGPVWDYDIAWGNADYFDGWKTTGFVYNFNWPSYEPNVPPFWWKRLRQDEIWEEDLRYTYHSLRRTTLSNNHIFHLIDSMAAEINEAQARNFTKWDILGTKVWPNKYVNGSFQGEIDYLKTWIGSRLAYLDANIPSPFGPLPVKFIDFKVKPENGFNQLSWEVEGDPLADYFSVERAGADNKFYEIGRVAFSNGVAKYSYKDYSNFESAAFYRIKEIDKNGEYVYSGIVSVRNMSGGAWKITPNVVKNTLVAVYSGSRSATVRTAIYSLNGHKVSEGRQSAANRLSIDVSGLAAGFYVLEIADDAGTMTRLRFVKE
ncbi:MAG: CotH kinase family protein [Chitinophagaceae bacterium]|nr:CotH kinase family protein [Chitinophagaceae bacterium]